MGNEIFGSQSFGGVTGNDAPSRPSEESKALVKQLRRSISINGLMDLISEY